MQTYLKNGYIVSMDQQDTVFDGGGVLVEDDRITAVGKVDPRLVKPDAEVIDLQGKYVLPGFVNTHVHTSQQISRGVGDDVDFICWLHDRMWPFESNMTEEDSYVSTLMTSLELIRSGVTSFAEPGGQFVSGMARGTAESGLRGKLAKSVMDCGEGLPEIWQRTMEQELEQQVVDLEKYHNTADGRVQVWFGLRTIFNNTDELCVRTKELADQYGVGIHMHVAEAKEEKEYTYARWGEGTVKHLERLGVLDKNLLAVHTVWLTDEELELFKKLAYEISVEAGGKDFSQPGFRHACAGLCTNPENAGYGAAALHRYGRRFFLQSYGHGGRDVADQPDPQGLASGPHGRSLTGYSADGHQVGFPRTAGRRPVWQSGMRQEGGSDRH